MKNFLVYKDIRKMKIGEWSPQIYKKGYNEMIFQRKKIKDGDVFWTVRLYKDGWFDTLSQGEAIMIGLLAELKERDITHIIKRKVKNVQMHIDRQSSKQRLPRKR